MAILCGCHVNIPQKNVPRPTTTGSGVTLPKLFSDNMVLQRDAAVPIWGWGVDGDTVTVEFRGQRYWAVVKDGGWMVTLRALKAGGPDTMTITCGPTIKLTNVLVGEVWLASGQSNMEFPLKNSYNAEGDIAKSANPMIRLLHVPRARLDAPTNNIGATWTECNPDTVPGFSAVEYYFARDLQKVLQVPVGIIESSWGGTPAEAWVQRSYLQSRPEYKATVFDEWNLNQDLYERNLASYNAKKKAAAESGTEFKASPPNRPWKPGELFDGMIAPLVGYGMKGVLWYQGESNAGNEEDAWEYHTLFPDLIRNWRADWGQGAFPFLLVQLAPFHAIKPEPSASSWASLREAQLRATQILPNVGMAVITDLGDQKNIHPTHKAPVGDRLALAAMAIAYHQAIEYSGPVLKEAKLDGAQIVLTFDHVAGGLATPKGEQTVTGFAICGPDGKYVWATAVIKGKDQVLVYSPEVSHPMAVRYGWADYPVVNLWNRAGLPASPFRTDDFDLR